MEDMNGWRQWAAQAIMTALLAALAAFGGIKVETAQLKATQTTYQAATDSRLDRMEDKLDRLIERRR